MGPSIDRRAMLMGMVALGMSAVVPRLSAWQAQASPAATTASGAVLGPAEMAGLMPAQVFFRGQSATVQMRNSGGIKFTDGAFVLAALVDTSGYSSGIQQRYQAYLITEVRLDLGEGGSGAALVPGAYGVGFIEADRFIAMDLGAHEVLNVSSHRDAELRRPTPLQLVAAPQAGAFRLYAGRSFVTICRAH